MAAVISILWPQAVQSDVRAWLERPDRDVWLPVTGAWDRIAVLVVGGPGKHSAFLPGCGANRTITRAIALKDGTPAASVDNFTRA